MDGGAGDEDDGIGVMIEFIIGDALVRPPASTTPPA
jgi:hypothetical protein